jgi:hypothetical protein
MGIETWYVLEDGSVGDPRDVSEGNDGILRHKDGRAVAYAPHGPRSRSVETDALPAGKRGRKKDKEAETPEAADMQPETPKRGYTTRETKAE